MRFAISSDVTQTFWTVLTKPLWVFLRCEISAPLHGTISEFAMHTTVELVQDHATVLIVIHKVGVSAVIRIASLKESGVAPITYQDISSI